jgi:hypothetical protein
MRKPNYRFERAERDRLKQAKKEEKARRQTGAGVGSEINKKGDAPFWSSVNVPQHEPPA